MGGVKMNIVGRLKEFNTTDFVCSYFAKFCLGLGAGLLFPERWNFLGWPLVFLALLVGFRAEVKFFRSRN